MSVKIVSLELENVKRVQVVRLEPSDTGLTVIGGDNRQGKTSILDGICYALGGERYRPSKLQRDGAMADARMEIKLSNGLLVERKGKNAALRVTDPAGRKGGQKLLDEFVEELALNLPKFLAMSGKDKADVLLRILGIGDKLSALEREERSVYEEREAFGRVADQKLKYFNELPWHADVPEEPVSAAELVRESQSVMQRNAKRAAAKQRLAEVNAEVDNCLAQQKRAAARCDELTAMLQQARQAMMDIQEKVQKAVAIRDSAISSAEITPDESTAEIEARMTAMEDINAKVRANLDKAKAKADSEDHAKQYAELTAKVDAVRARRRALLDGATMPLPGLSVEAGELTYNGAAWDCMSGAERIRAGAAIVRKLRPECGFILLDELEKLDREELAALSAWLEEEGLQAIATRVSTGDECSIVIEDGLVAKRVNATATEPKQKEEADW